MTNFQITFKFLCQHHVSMFRYLLTPRHVSIRLYCFSHSTYGLRIQTTLDKTSLYYSKSTLSEISHPLADSLCFIILCLTISSYKMMNLNSIRK
jgi:hypothetical protein